MTAAVAVAEQRAELEQRHARPHSVRAGAVKPAFPERAGADNARRQGHQPYLPEFPQHESAHTPDAPYCLKIQWRTDREHCPQAHCERHPGLPRRNRHGFHFGKLRNRKNQPEEIARQTDWLQLILLSKGKRSHISNSSSPMSEQRPLAYKLRMARSASWVMDSRVSRILSLVG